MDNISSLSPEDILQIITESRIDLYNKRNKSLSISDNNPCYFNPIPINYEFKSTKHDIDNDTSFVEEYNSFENDINHFNQLYEDHGYILSQHYEDELDKVYKIVEDIVKNFNSKTPERIVTLNSPIRVQPIVMKLILDQIRDLIKFSEEIELQQKIEKEKEAAAEREREIEREKVAAAAEREREIEREKEAAAEREREIEREKEAAAERERELEREQKAMGEIDREYRACIRKTVNHWCSQVTTGNPEHSLGRLQELLLLLNYQSVPLVGSEGREFIDLRSHPLAMDYFWADLDLAVLTQAQTQFALNIDTALVFASLLTAVFNYFPDRLNGIMGTLTKKCEELLTSDASTTDNDQTDHDLDQDEQNVRGLSRFMAALSVARPPPGYSIPENLGPGTLWTHLASLVNSKLVSSLSAEACKALLEIGGTTLRDIYGDQFWKLLAAIRSKYENISGGLSIRSLIILIDEAAAKQSFELEGYVPSDVWWRANE